MNTLYFGDNLHGTYAIIELTQAGDKAFPDYKQIHLIRLFLKSGMVRSSAIYCALGKS